MTSPAPDLSVCLPVYNESGNIEKLIDETAAAIEPTGRSFEVVCVDDKSKDDSLAVMRGLQASRPWLVVEAQRINQGQSAALAVALRRSRGEIVIIMDSDGQNDPADIPALLEAMGPEVDCCCGIRQKRRDTFGKRWGSKFGNGVRKLITGGTVTDAGCAFKGIRRRALGEVPVFNGMHRWLATMLEHQGFTVTEIPINHREREHGVSAYTNWERALRGLPDCFAMRWYSKRAVRGDRWQPDAED